MINTQQLLQFIQNHWALCLAFVATLAFLIFEELKGKMGGIARISPQNATILLNRENATIIDLRNQNAFSSGHIINSFNIERNGFDTHIHKIESHKNHPIILLDEADNHIAAIGTKLKKSGFTKIYLLSGGLQAWKNAQLPITKN